jgi:hypothetical protein
VGALVGGFGLAMVFALLLSLAFGSDHEAWGSVLQLLLNVVVLTAVAAVGIPVQRAIWLRAARRAAATLPPNLQQTGG